MNPAARVVVIVLVVAGIGGGYLWWRKQQTPPPPPPPPVQAVAPAPPPAAPPPDAAPAIRHPVEARAAPRPLPALADADPYVKDALIDLLGRKGVLSFLNVEGFVRRFVATVDNLANERATVQLWPVNPTAGSFLIETRPEGSVIGARNADRYTALVRFVDGVDTRRAVALYLRLYPLFQQAYEELGYPGKYFNDRLVEVIDHLLATPAVAGPIKVRLIEAPGAPTKAARPVSLYQFEDPTLEARSAGQKILLRVGRENAQKLQAKLADVRRQITKNAPPSR